MSAEVRRPQIAIIGAGPSGCYTAQALIRELPDAEITVFDAMPVPYGLVRHGVAADHQGTKSVSKQFARLFERDGVRFVGGIEIGGHVDLATLRTAFDAIVLAHGLHADKPLEVPGADLDGVVGAGRITRLLNGHAGEERPAPSLGSSVAVIGMGNVAMDITRLLAKTSADLIGSDIDDDAHRDLANDIRSIHLIGRSDPVDAKFDAVMARELLHIPGVEHVVHDVDRGSHDQLDARSVVVRELARSKPPQAARVRIDWWFGHVPERITGSGRVAGIDIASIDSGIVTSIPVQSVIPAIGFTATSSQRLVDVPAEAGDSGRIEAGLYVAGWARRGPRGTIASHRTESKQLAKLIAGDIRQSSGRPGTRALHEYLRDTTTYDDWLRVDEHETARAHDGRVRRKVTDIAEMRAIAFAGRPTTPTKESVS